MQYSKIELPAGEGQLIVMFVNDESAGGINVGAFGNAIAEDANARRGDGWRLMSVASMPISLSGTSTVLFQSGGQLTTQAALIATYQQVLSPTV